MTPLVPRPTRRQFLKTGAAGGALLLIGVRADETLAQGPPAATRPNPFDAWIQIDARGQVTFKFCKAEMGQGVMTALPLILADELEVEWSSVKVEQSPTDPKIYQHGTGGSSSVRSQWMPLRQAAASARTMLVRAAAERWGVSPDDCHAELGGVVRRTGAQRLGYGELVEAAAKLPLPELGALRLKDAKDFRLVGRGAPRVDIPSKVDGSARYGLDVRVPNMLFAVVARCPAYGGKATKWNAAAAKAVRGVKHVVEIAAVESGVFSRGGVAVVADSTWAAIKGREALAVEWDRGAAGSESSAGLAAQFDRLVAQPGKVIRNEGDADSVLQSAAKRVDAVYDVPLMAHAAMEPMNATVYVRADGAEAWLATQSPDWNQGEIAKAVGLPSEKVVVHTTLLGGSFGRRAHTDFAVEAALVSKAVAAPVQVVWTREDDMQFDFYRPASRHGFQAGLDASGKPLAWRHRMASTSIDGWWEAAKGTPENSELSGASNLPYAIPNLKLEYAAAQFKVPVMWWRSVEHSANGFVVEAFIDELAAAAGKDPLAFRLELLAEPRMLRFPADDQATLDTRRLKAVLELAAERAGWSTKPPAGRARGIAAHFSFFSYVAHVAEVSLERGQPRVHRVVSAVDCGQVIDPDGVRAQVESAVVYGLSAALKGAITIAGGASEQTNFHNFEVLRIGEMPQVDVHLVPSREAPSGIGEPGLPPIAPAVANAFFALTGKRLRRLPIRATDFA